MDHVHPVATLGFIPAATLFPLGQAQSDSIPGTPPRRDTSQTWHAAMSALRCCPRPQGSPTEERDGCDMCDHRRSFPRSTQSASPLSPRNLRPARSRLQALGGSGMSQSHCLPARSSCRGDVTQRGDTRSLTCCAEMQCMQCTVGSPVVEADSCSGRMVWPQTVRAVQTMTWHGWRSSDTQPLTIRESCHLCARCGACAGQGLASIPPPTIGYRATREHRRR
jgi:hypothetical protein